MATPLRRELPNFIKARSPDRLRALMIKNNIRLRATVNYFDIQFVNKNWYAWYFEPLEKSPEVTELNGTTENN